MPAPWKVGPKPTIGQIDITTLQKSLANLYAKTHEEKPLMTFAELVAQVENKPVDPKQMDLSCAYHYELDNDGVIRNLRIDSVALVEKLTWRDRIKIAKELCVSEIKLRWQHILAWLKRLFHAN